MRTFRGFAVRVADSRGFTLIELLTVVTIIAILVAIAVPMFLGMREKAKTNSIISSARSTVSEVQAWLNAFQAGEAILFTDSSGAEICVQAASVTQGKSCSAAFAAAAASTYSAIDDLVPLILSSYQGKGLKSPYNSSRDLFSDTVASGVVVVSNSGDRSIHIVGYAEDTASPVFNTTVTTH